MWFWLHCFILFSNPKTKNQAPPSVPCDLWQLWKVLYIYNFFGKYVQLKSPQSVVINNSLLYISTTTMILDVVGNFFWNISIFHALKLDFYLSELNFYQSCLLGYSSLPSENCPIQKVFLLYSFRNLGSSIKARGESRSLLQFLVAWKYFYLWKALYSMRIFCTDTSQSSSEFNLSDRFSI